MTFPVLGGNSAVVAVGEASSLRFNDDDSPKLKRTTTGSGTQSTYTFSAWCKRSGFGSYQYLFSHRASGGANAYGLAFDRDSEKLYVYNGSLDLTTAVYRDASAWYHIVLSVSSGSYTLYVNGSSVKTGSAQSIVLGESMTIGAYEYSTTVSFFDGYMAEVHFIDGTAKSPTDFGEFDSTSGIWKPKTYSGSYGTNGFKLNFSDSGSLGADSSGNGNNFTPTNLASTDQTTDTPTNNFATLNSLDNYWANSTFSEGNCKMVTAGSGYGYPRSTMGVSSGKWYFEAKASNLSGNLFVGIVSTTGTGTEQEVGNKSNDYGYKFTSGAIRENTVETSYGDSLGTSDILGVGIDLDNNKLYFSKNGTWQNSANPETNTGGFSITAPSSTLLGEYFASASDINSVNSSTVAFNFGNPAFSVSSGNADGNGYGNFEYAPPSGYLALCTQNLATALSPTIDDGSQYFNTVLYTGNASAGHSITGVGFQPDWTWIKSRSSTESHWLWDSVRGTDKGIKSNTTNSEYSSLGGITSFDSDGFTLGAYDGVNANSQTFVGWNWKASGSTASNTDGTITSTVSANTTAGFSIVTYTGNNTQGATVGHGLGKAPAMIFVKGRDQVTNWNSWHKSFSDNQYIALDLTVAVSIDGNTFPDASDMTSSTFEIGSASWVNGNGNTFVAYCFAEIEGYSKIGTYTGNGSTNGTFIYTGFRPAWILRKSSSNVETWSILDSTRSPINAAQDVLRPNESNAEGSATWSTIDILSNGFKMRATDAATNGSGATYIYMAFAENPFVDSSGVPANAR